MNSNAFLSRRGLRRALLLLCVGAAGGAGARVFFRTPAGGSGAAALGWTRVQQRSALLNGRSAETVLWASSDEPGTAIERAAARHERTEGPVLRGLGEHFAWAALLRAGRPVRLLAFSAGARGCLVLEIEESAGGGPPGQSLPGTPVYPGSTPRLTFADQDNRLAMEVAAAPVSPDTVRRYAEERLGRDGWTPAPGSGGLLFVRGRETGALSVISAGQGAGSVLTWIQQRPRSGRLPR